jgi:DHA1 family bicyclomycin/chloramphenicol resistance-like MFS transporter
LAPPSSGVQSSSRLARHIGPQWIVAVVAVATVGLLATATAIVVLDAAGAGLWGILIPLWLPVIGLIVVSTAIPMGIMMMSVSVVAILVLWKPVRPRWGTNPCRNVSNVVMCLIWLD